MSTPHLCPACGAANADGRTCEDLFHQMLFWENEYPQHTLAVHHILVASYYIQHPHLYSPEGLQFSISLLAEFVAGVEGQAKGRQIRAAVQSGVRTFKIKGTPESHGSYPVPIAWTLYAHDVTDALIEGYDAAVRAWGASIVAALRAAGQM